MRLIVTGTAEGQLVGSLIERAPTANAEIIAVGLPKLDMSEPSTIAPALKGIEADIIVNAAAFTAVDKAEMNEALAMRINGDAAGEAARIARRQNLPFLHISTDYVFDGSATRPYREDDSTGPTSAYGRTKLAGERAVIDADPTATILRTAWVYSPFSVNFVKTMLRLGETRAEVSVVADQRGNPSYALDLADAVLSIARQRVERRGEGFWRRRLSHDGVRRSDLGGPRGRSLRRGRAAGATAGQGQAHHISRIPDADPTPGEFATRQFETRARLRRRPA